MKKYAPRVTGSVSKPAPKRPPKQVLIDRLNQPGTYEQIGAEFGACGSAVTRWCWYYNIINPRKYKLEECDIPLIRELKGHLTAAEVGKKFNVSARTIRDVWNGKYWSWVVDHRYTIVI